MTDLQTSALLTYGLIGIYTVIFYVCATHTFGVRPIRQAGAWLHSRIAHWHRQRMARKRYEAEARHIEQLRRRSTRHFL